MQTGLARMAAIRRVAASLVTSLVTSLGFGIATPAFAEQLVMPYRCEARGGDLRMAPSEPRAYRIFGAREHQVLSVCSPEDPSRCRNLMINRFDLDCGGLRVPWLRVVAAAPAGERGQTWVEGGRLHLDTNAFWGPSQAARQDEPYPRPQSGPGGDWFADDAPYPEEAYGSGGAARRGVIELPPGFAPTLGLRATFIDGDGIGGAGGDVTARSATAPPLPSLGYDRRADVAETGPVRDPYADRSGYASPPANTPPLPRHAEAAPTPNPKPTPLKKTEKPTAAKTPAPGKPAPDRPAPDKTVAAKSEIRAEKKTQSEETAATNAPSAAVASAEAKVAGAQDAKTSVPDKPVAQEETARPSPGAVTPTLLNGPQLDGAQKSSEASPQPMEKAAPPAAQPDAVPSKPQPLGAAAPTPASSPTSTSEPAAQAAQNAIVPAAPEVKTETTISNVGLSVSPAAQTTPQAAGPVIWVSASAAAALLALVGFALLSRREESRIAKQSGQRDFASVTFGGGAVDEVHTNDDTSPTLSVPALPVLPSTPPAITGLGLTERLAALDKQPTLDAVG